MNGLSAVLQYVINKYNGCKTYETDKDAQENAWITDTNMQPEDLEAVKQFIMSKEACSEEKARDIFLNERHNVLNGRGKRKVFFSIRFVKKLVLACLPILVILGILAERPGFEAIMKAPVLLIIGLLLILICIVVGFSLWNPRLRAYNKAWRKYDHMQEKLEKLCEIENMPFIKLVFKHQLVVTLIFLVICLYFIGNAAMTIKTDIIDVQKLQSAMAGITVSQDCRGTRYAVYDAAEEKYVRKYLKEEHLAQTAEDVCAVIRIEHEEKQVKRYALKEFSVSADAYGYRRCLVISLIDQKTGNSVGVVNVFGEDPPDRVRISGDWSSSEKKKVYGAGPSDKEITEACYSLIERFEAQQNTLDP